MNKVSLIVTVLNEEGTIIELLKSIRRLSHLPSEVVIVDGGSIDHTVKLAKEFSEKCAKRFPKLIIKVFTKKGNRSVGRNYAISRAKNDWIAITDAGCVLDKNWLKELIKKQKELKTEVVAGYYRSLVTTPFEEAVTPYVLVMPDKIDENNFLPATRSVLINKKVWKSLEGFDEKLSDNEDYDFAKRLKSSGIKIGFAKNVVVSWIPNSTLKSFSRMIFRFARGDIFSGIVRPKVLLIFVRYLLGIVLVIWGILNNSYWILFGLIPVFMILYILWSIYKNYRYARRGWYWLPVLQISSDLAVIEGSFCGAFDRVFS